MSCGVCFASFEEVNPIKLTCSCIHCAECLSSWIKAQIMELEYHTYQTIKCMTSDCQEVFRVHDILSQFPQKITEELNLCLLDFYLRSAKDVRKCPKDNCSFAGVINLNESCTKEYECLDCGALWKEKAQFSFNAGQLGVLTDLDFTTNEIFSFIWEEFNTNKCPTCAINIEKNGGCPHMTCKKCGHEFCWYCKQPYSTHLSRMCIIKFAAKVTFFIMLFYHLLSLSGLLPVLGDLIVWCLKSGLKVGLLNSFLYPMTRLLEKKKPKLSAKAVENRVKVIISLGLVGFLCLFIHVFDIYTCIFKICILEALILFCVFVPRSWLGPWVRSVY